MTRRERLRAAIERQPIDRVPYAFWRRFPAVDRSPAGLAQATLRFHDRYGSDCLTLAPPAGFAAAAWGCVEAEEAGPDGARPCGRCAIARPEDWRRIRALDPAAAAGLHDVLETVVRVGFDRRVADAPVVLALPSPLAVAARLGGGRLGADLAEWPRAVADALEAITETLVRLAEAVLAEGVAGLLYEVGAREDVARHGEASDRCLLEAIRSRSSLLIVHVGPDAAGDAVASDRFRALPADAWSGGRRPDREASPRGAWLGGLDPETLRHGGSEEAVAAMREALAATGGRGLILGAAGPIAPGTPDAPLAAVVRALGGPLKPILGLTR